MGRRKTRPVSIRLYLLLRQNRQASCIRYRIGSAEALEDAGFIYTKCIKGFHDREYIESFSNSEGGNNNQTQKRIQGVNTRVVCLKIDVDTEAEEFL